MSSSKQCNQCKPCKQCEQFKAFKASLILVFLLIIIESEHEYITSPSSGCEQHKLTLISTFLRQFLPKMHFKLRKPTRCKSQAAIYTLARCTRVAWGTYTHGYPWLLAKTPLPPPPSPSCFFLIEGVHCTYFSWLCHFSEPCCFWLLYLVSAEVISRLLIPCIPGGAGLNADNKHKDDINTPLRSDPWLHACNEVGGNAWGQSPGKWWV